MQRAKTIGVHYPVREGHITLRSDVDDWKTDLEPVSVDESGERFEFRFESNRPFFYFRPVLHDRKQEFLSETKYLALMTGPELREVFPHFFEQVETPSFARLAVPSGESSSQHEITVYHPPGYEENTLRRYPVLYMQDGQNLFFPEDAFAGNPWRVDEVVKLLDAMNVVRKAIIVGIYPNERMKEYTYPGYAEYGRYVVEELKPFIDENYRVMTDPGNTAVMGSSLGGVVSFYLAWQYPEVFGKAACMSSTFTHSDDLVERVLSEERRPIRIYLDSGWPGDNFEVTRCMRDALFCRGYTPGVDVLYYGFPQGIHNEQSWAMRSHIPFQFFFGR